MPPTSSSDSSSLQRTDSTDPFSPVSDPKKSLLEIDLEKEKKPCSDFTPFSLKVYFQDATILPAAASKFSTSTNTPAQTLRAPEPLGVLKITQAITLNQVRPLIENELDVPDEMKFLPNHTSWSNMVYTFLLDTFPVGVKQESSIRLPDDLTSGSISIRFDDVTRKKMKFDTNETSSSSTTEEKNDKTNEQNEKEQIKVIERFHVVTEDIICNRQVLGQKKYLVFINNSCSSNIDEQETYEACQLLSTITNIQEFYNTKCKIKQDSLLFHLPKISNVAKSSTRNTFLFKGLVDYLEKEYESVNSTIQNMMKDNRISFDKLWFLFQKDTTFQTRFGEDIVGSTVLESRSIASFFGDYFQVTGNFISTNGKTFCYVTRTFTINEFEGTREISELPIRPLTEETKILLTERGKKFRELALGSHYLHYNGSMKYHEWCTRKFKADGRIMIDTASFSRFNPNYADFRFVENDDQSKIINSLSDEKLFMTWPTVPGFSFSAKKWGEFSLNNITPVIFDDQAFSQLVLNQETKRLIRCLVTNSGHCFTDIISGKGGGVIFLCHGPPGTGKTLTAEAVSELLHKPLYCVNIGELGVTPNQMEERLSQILEMASSWNAIILLDEADIFLERRTNNDIERNALVGIFLRLLEYHQGVLFLTTNRVQSFDEAFHSRISIALQYQSLTQDARKQIWKNLLTAAKIEYDLNLDQLSEYDLNGRQIKNIIRLAQTIAHEEKKPISRIDIEKCVNVAKQFQADVETIRETEKQ